MAPQAAGWLLLVLAAGGALLALTAVLRVRNLQWGNVSWFLLGWLGSELAAWHALIAALVAAGCVLAGALDTAPGQAGLVLTVAAWGGFALAQARARPAPAVLEAALTEGLGAGFDEAIPPARRARLVAPVPPALAINPFALFPAEVERLRDIHYHEGADRHERHVLDIHRPRGGVTGAPVLLQIHGGGWILGNKHEQGLPLVNHLVTRGWIAVATNYRLSPQARFPDHLVDCKRALAWVRANIARYGGDPSFVVVTGGSAGGHLASLVALTANRPALQPGFESVDTSVAAAVPFYGVYDFPDRHRLRFDRGLMARWLGETVMPRTQAEDPEAWDLASPVVQVHAGAPPFFVLHGTHDSLVVVEEARAFVRELRRVSRNPVAYAELPGAQHAWEIFRSVRTLHTVNAVARFAEWCYARR